MTNNGEPRSISRPALKRLPSYLQFLKALHHDGVQSVSAPIIARALHLNEVQVRKDLASVSTASGRPKTGFSTNDLIRDIAAFLGYDNVNQAVLVGAGHLGQALLSYQGFENYGIQIVAAFDSDPALIGTQVAGKTVLALDKLEDVCRRMKIRIGIITVPDAAAQEICNRLVEGDVCAIWNFAPVHLQVPQHVLVQNENMAESLALLSEHLANKIQAEGIE